MSSSFSTLERVFYEKQMVLERWGVRELKRQRESGPFLRLAASKDEDWEVTTIGSELSIPLGKM